MVRIFKSVLSFYRRMYNLAHKCVNMPGKKHQLLKIKLQALDWSHMKEFKQLFQSKTSLVIVTFFHFLVKLMLLKDVDISDYCVFSQRLNGSYNN